MLQREVGSFNASGVEQVPGEFDPSVQGFGNHFRRQVRHGHGNEPVAQVRVVLQLAGGLANDSGMFGIHRSGDQRGRNIGLSRCPRQYRDRIGDSEGVRASAPFGGGEAANRSLVTKLRLRI